MKNQPVLYESLKTILSYTDPNLRINMSQRMPSIRATEKAVPLKMRYLSISDTTVEINDVRYELGVYRGYPNEDVLHGLEIYFDRFDYIQLSTIEDGQVTPLQRLVYTRELYKAVKHFNHILFANRPVIQVNELVCLANEVYRIPVGLKISANDLTVRPSQIASIATMLEGDVNRLRVFREYNAKNWWQHRLVQNAKELITEDSSSAEKSCLMLKTFGNKIVRFYNLLILTTEQYCELVESWMSVKREVGSELWIGLHAKTHRDDVLTIIQTRLEVVRRDERSVRILGENGTRVEVCEEVCVDETMRHRWAVEVKIIEN